MKSFKPMLAASTVPDLASVKYPVLASPKLDGIRCLIIDGVAYSRNLKIIPNIHVRETLAKLNLDSLDGELMINGDFNSVQSAIMSEQGKPDFCYNVFDDFKQSHLPFHTRNSYASLKVASTKSKHVNYVQQEVVKNPEELLQLWEHWLSEGYEGAIVRDPKAPYKFGRSTLKQGWMLKLKKFDDGEAEIIGHEELMHNANEAMTGELGQTKRSHHQANMVRSGMLGSFLCIWNDVTFNLGTGFDEAQRRRYWMFKSNTIGSLAKFKFQGVGPNGKPRFPVFLGFRSRDDV